MDGLTAEAVAACAMCTNNNQGIVSGGNPATLRCAMCSVSNIRCVFFSSSLFSIAAGIFRAVTQTRP